MTTTERRPSFHEQEALREKESKQRRNDFVNAGVGIFAELNALQTYGLSGEGANRAFLNVHALSTALRRTELISSSDTWGFLNIANYIVSQFQIGDYVSGLVDGWVEGRLQERSAEDHELTDREMFALYTGREELRRVMKSPVVGHRSRMRVRVAKALESFPETRWVMGNAAYNPYHRFKHLGK